MRNSSLLFYGIFLGSPCGLEISTKIFYQSAYETYANYPLIYSEL